MSTATQTRSKVEPVAAADPLWFKDAIIYQLHVRAFCDSSGDGIGDFRGLTSKLDYIRDLGVTAIWLLPFFPSPLRDDGYDIADYTAVNPAYGTLRDVKVFLEEAHARDLRVITELVMNHTSDQHEWFQKSRRAKPGSKWRDFYVWSDTAEKYQEARIIFQDFEPSNWTWDPVAQAYFWHRFYHHQPDLNFDNPAVHDAMLATIDFWYDLGVDGVRLDAVPYLYEREGTNCENLPETHAFLAKLRKHVDEKYADKMLLAEANQWPEDAAAYFGNADECHMNFHFPLMPRLFMAVEREDRFPIIDILEQTPNIPDNCQWGIFLRNHDELTLEMVTDEERDYMYRAYADDPRARVNLGIRRRLAPLLKDNRRKMELMNALLLSLPGTPIMYYGDEIPMGDNIYLGDRDGCRTPMQWNDDRNAGFSRANPQRLYLPVNIDSAFHYATRNVEVELSRPHSLLWWTRRIVSLRKQHKAFGRGTLKFLRPKNAKVLCYLREYEGETVLIVANLSRYAQCAEVDLSAFRGQMPIELFGQTKFPPIGTLPYFFTLGPYAFYWFRLAKLEKESEDLKSELPKCRISGNWDALFSGKPLQHLEAALPGFLQRHRWFHGIGRTILRAKVMDVIPLQDIHAVAQRPREGKQDTTETPPTRLLLVNVDFVDGGSHFYTVPVVFAAGEQERNILGDHPGAGIIRVKQTDADLEATLCDSARESEFWLLLHDAALRRRAIAGKHGELAAVSLHEPFRVESVEANGDGAPHAVHVTTDAKERRNAHGVLGGKYQWKLYRRTGEGINPDLEVSRLLSEKENLAAVPKLAAALDYVDGDGERYTLAVAHEFIPNQGTGWRYAMDELQRYVERVLAEKAAVMPAAEMLPSCSMLQMAEMPVSESAKEIVGSFLQTAEILGQRTAELHAALASAEEKEFVPAPFGKLYQRSIYQSIRVQTLQAFDQLRQQAAELPPAVQQLADKVLVREGALYGMCSALKDRRIDAQRIRCHGNLQLLHVLFTGKDFMIINFEGEHVRPLSERRIKATPIKDVASMIRSFHYASQAAPLKSPTDAPPSEELRAKLSAWLKVWYRWSAASFLKSYLATASAGSFLPVDRESLSVLLNAYLLDKAAVELIHELRQRPERVAIPLDGMLELLQHC